MIAIIRSIRGALVQPTPVLPNAIRFGLFEADLATGELRKRGRKIPLQDQPFRVLALLLLRPGELVTREELQRALWSADTFGDFDEGLNKAIQKLRQALDDSSDNPRFIETLPRKGYRFIAPVDRTAGQASAALAQATPVDSNAVSPQAPGPVKRRSTAVLAWALLGVVLVALAVLAGVYFLVTRPASRPALRTVPLTSYPGRQITPAISPDGKQVAFAWDGEKDNFDIYVKLVDAGEPLRLTSDPAPEYAPAWSPDARYIAFCRDVSDYSEILMIPALGGAERKLGESVGCGLGLSWSPDGKYLALADKNTAREPYSIFLLSIETGTKRKLTSPPAESRWESIPAFSPDGRTLAFNRYASDINDAIYLLSLTSDGTPLGEPRRLTHDERAIQGLDWTADGRRIVYTSGQIGSTNLFAIPSSGGAPERVSVADANPMLLSVSRTGSRLVYERQQFDSNIWRIPGPNSSDTKSGPVRFIASTEADGEPQFSRDDTKIVFSSTRSGKSEIWVCDREGRNAVQLTSFNGPEVGSPRLSPDARWVAFDSDKAGKYDIYVVSTAGGQPRRLTSGRSLNVRPSWSQDGRWIYFGSNRSGDWQIWKQPAQSGTAIPVAKTEGADEAFESLDGNFVYYAKLDVPGIWKTPVAGGEATLVLEGARRSVWAITGQGICFFDLTGSTGAALKYYNFATGKVKLLREFSKDPPIETGETELAVSSDGRWILYTQLDQFASNLMLVENFR
jgi:Tol biopolymer transport system component/DNA-binding winged helix-turn-helix (wHTH) protein